MGSGGLPGTVWIIVALGLLWLLVAAAISIIAARRFRLAEEVLGAARSGAALLEANPSRPLLVRADNRIEIDAQLARDLGFSSQPRHLADLSGNDYGIAAEDLEALKAFFRAMPPKTGLAFVVVIHLDPTHESLMAELLSHVTGLTVEQARDRQPLELDHVYVIPPNRTLTIDQGLLRVKEVADRRSLRGAIDHFFRSLAEAERDQAVAIAAVAAEHDVRIETSGGFTRPPKPLTPEAEALFALVRQAGADLGQAIGWQPTGGVCDGNNIAACGVPVVDTMGVRGGKIHSMEEYLIVDSLAERAALSALTILRLAGGGA